MNLMKLINGYFKDALIDVRNLPIREWIKMYVDDIFRKCINMY